MIDLFEMYSTLSHLHLTSFVAEPSSILHVEEAFNRAGHVIGKWQ